MLMTLVVYGAYIFVIAFTLWMAIDAGKQDRFWWLVLIIGIPFVGSSVYFFTEKKHEYAKAEPHHVHESETEAQHEMTPKKRRPRKQAVESVATEVVHHEEHSHETVHEHKEETAEVKEEFASTEE